MSRQTITDPLMYKPSVTLRLIENDPDSFTEGRRNNDLVNWFVVCRIGEIESGIELRANRFYVDDFNEMMDELSEKQVYDLKNWSESYEAKLRNLHQYYGHHNVTALRYIWQSMDYETEPPVHKDQSKLPV